MTNLPRDAIRQARDFAETLIPACVATIVFLAATAQLRAQAEADWVGKRVVPRTRDFVLRIDDEPVESSRKTIAIYLVERTDGPKLWLQAEDQKRLNGWARAQDVILFERAIDFFADHIRTHPKDAFAHAMRANVRVDKNEFAAGLLDYDQAIRLDPGNASLHFERGNVRTFLGEADRAIADYTEAIRLDPRFALAFTGRGTAWTMKKNEDKAIEDYSEAIWIDPLSIPAHLLRGAAWQAKQEHQKAMVDYNMVIRLDPENAPAYTRRALAWKSLKTYSKAVADLELAVQQHSREPLSFESLAWIRATCPDKNIRDGAKAVVSATKACEMTAWKDARCLATLAAAMAESGDFDSAVTWQTKANAFYPQTGDRTRGETRLQLYRKKTPYRETGP